MATARVVTLIEVQSSWGHGGKGDPVRIVTEWFTPEGELVFTRDPHLRAQAEQCVRPAPEPA